MEEKRKVRIDWFLADVANVEIEVTEELLTALVGNAIEYIMVNGTMPWDKWSLLSKCSRDAFVAAAKQLKLRDTLDISE